MRLHLDEELIPHPVPSPGAHRCSIKGSRAIPQAPLWDSPQSSAGGSWSLRTLSKPPAPSMPGSAALEHQDLQEEIPWPWAPSGTPFTFQPSSRWILGPLAQNLLPCPQLIQDRLDSGRPGTPCHRGGWSESRDLPGSGGGEDWTCPSGWPKVPPPAAPPCPPTPQSPLTT